MPLHLFGAAAEDRAGGGAEGNGLAAKLHDERAVGSPAKDNLQATVKDRRVVVQSEDLLEAAAGYLRVAGRALIVLFRACSLDEGADRGAAIVDLLGAAAENEVVGVIAVDLLQTAEVDYGVLRVAAGADDLLTTIVDRSIHG